MEWYETIFELIDMRSFSNLWFWIALAVLWSTASHWVLGVPFDMVARARRDGGQAAEDMHALLAINVRRMLLIARISGLWMIGIVAFVLTFLTILAVFYSVEFAQAVLALAAPMTLVGLLNLSTARRIEVEDPEGPLLYKRLANHRRLVQVIGMLSIFVTAMWGMWQNMKIGALGAL